MGEIRDILRDNLEYLFAKSEMTKKQISEKLNVSPSSLTNWTKGDNSPDIETIAKICKLFSISVVDLFEYDLRNDKKITPPDDSVQPADEFTSHERKIIAAYREHPDMQKSVDKLLGVGSEPNASDDIKKIMNDTETAEVMAHQRSTKS